MTRFVIKRVPPRVTFPQPIRREDANRPYGEMPEEPVSNWWQCDIFPDEGGDFHGVGRTEAEAVHQASIAWVIHTARTKRD